MTIRVERCVTTHEYLFSVLFASVDTSEERTGRLIGRQLQVLGQAFQILHQGSIRQFADSGFRRRLSIQTAFQPDRILHLSVRLIAQVPCDEETLPTNPT